MYALYVLSKYIISNNIEFAIDLLNIKSSDRSSESSERERERKMIKMHFVVNATKSSYNAIRLPVTEIF